MTASRILMIVGLTACFTSARLLAPRSGTAQTTPLGKGNFSWSAGKRAAISLTFDDARPSQIDMGMPIFDKYGLRATFYISPDNIGQRLKGWKLAVKNGHEIGNHKADAATGTPTVVILIDGRPLAVRSVAERVLSSQAMTPTSGDTRNFDSGPIGNCDSTGKAFISGANCVIIFGKVKKPQ